ncbi:general stress protein [Cryobacterium sp. BB307]|uniref:general stress protein n=1 Tax=Cryobacterium sp. BB307 TaxID=2716317 RepID=UPI00144827A9|nr:general stress protein [Cryobacterium sp. BB307]
MTDASVQPTEEVAQTPLREFSNYREAAALVDKLSDDGFDVSRLRIVGTGLRSVEQITGRMTVAKAAGMGAIGGAWFGLLIGVIFGLFVIGIAWWAVLLFSVLLGALWGAIFGAIGQWSTRGQRDFSSVKTMEASSYSVMVDVTHADEARRMLGAGL